MKLTYLHIYTTAFLYTLISVSLLVACEDESANSSENNAFIRDASVPIVLIDPSDPMQAQQDMMVTSDDMDTSWTESGTEAGTTAGTVSECQAGDRLLNNNGCGYQVCSGGMWIDPSNSSETCNNHDDDCDGRVDEDFSIGAMCYVMENGCQVEGVYACNEMIGTAICESTGMGSMDEECDGVDNDCDGNVDEGFPNDVQCCSENLHCSLGGMCVDGYCDNSSTVNPGTNPTPFENLAGGSCQQPIVMSEFGVYIPNVNNATQELTVVDCTGSFDTDLGLAAQTALGREAVLSFTLPAQQRVRITTQYLEPLLIASAPVVYVRQGVCNDSAGTSIYCDQSIVGLADEAPRNAQVEFMAQANTTYYVIVDLKVDFAEDLTLFPILFEAVP